MLEICDQRAMLDNAENAGKLLAYEYDIETQGFHRFLKASTVLLIRSRCCDALFRK
jgi:hypothetical protein